LWPFDAITEAIVQQGASSGMRAVEIAELVCVVMQLETCATMQQGDKGRFGDRMRWQANTDASLDELRSSFSNLSWRT
jgi:hypothetical protein